jgi:hypothetical protein
LLAVSKLAAEGLDFMDKDGREFIPQRKIIGS